jgi:hypothetical protein
VGLDRELRKIAEAAVAYASDSEELAGIVPAEPVEGVRLYVCAFNDGDETSWLVLDADGSPVEDRGLVRSAVSISALWELASELSGEEDEELRVATPALLDSAGDSPDFVAAVKQPTPPADELVRDVERGYKLPLS